MDTSLSERARVATDEPRGGLRDLLGHPLAIGLTIALLFAIYGSTFVLHPDRTAPTRDPAFYTWRIEALTSEEPVRLIEIEGAFSMFAVGYRVTAPILGAFLRHIPGLSVLNATSFLMVVLPVSIAILLGAFAYRHFRDPLAFHIVALVGGSLLLTQPFVGYLDNVLCIFWLVAGIFFLSATRASWRARIAFFTFLLLAGLTHPTTLAAFCLVLGIMAGLRLIGRRFDIRSVIRDDGPMLLAAAAAALATYGIWKIGPWGRGASLGESALSPPYGRDFFFDRLVNEWLAAMNPFLNGVLLIAGIAGVLAAAGRRRTDNDLALLSLAWLVPLVGVFGFVTGAAYPYYRFFNITPMWVLLCGFGAAFIARALLDIARRGGLARFALVGLVAIGGIVVANFGSRFPTWTDPKRGWLSGAERTEMESLRTVLLSGDRHRPVVFVIDDRPPRPFQIWAFTKLSGNTSRHALPSGQIDQGYLYLGSIHNYLEGRPTTIGEPTYDRLSPALLEDAERGIERSGKEPVVVLASVFNTLGANSDLVDVPDDVVVVRGDLVTTGGGSTQTAMEIATQRSPLHVLWVLVGCMLLLLPGALAIRWVMPDASRFEVAALVPAVSAAMLTCLAFVVLSITRSPFTAPYAWGCVVALIGSGAALWWRDRYRDAGA